MKKIGILIFLIAAQFSVSAQKRVNAADAIKYKGKLIEVVGHAFLIKTISKDEIIMSVGYNRASANFLVDLKVASAQTIGSLTHTKFGHFKGTVTTIDGKPGMLITNVKNYIFYAPRNEFIDSALLLKNK